MVDEDFDQAGTLPGERVENGDRRDRVAREKRLESAERLFAEQSRLFDRLPDVGDFSAHWTIEFSAIGSLMLSAAPYVCSS